MDALSAAPVKVVIVPVRSPELTPRNRVLVSVIASAAVIAAGLIFFYLWMNTDKGNPQAAPTPTAGKISGDDSEFVGDITYPDGSKVRQGSSFEKVWRIRNAGTVSWEGRRLARMNTGPCRSPEAVDIPSTAPGQTVDIMVRVRAPNRPGNCRIYWKVIDARGQTLFPLKRPVFLDVQVGPS
ncbi:hypothetical protein FHR32_003482 [Streptosporangium album]|uniref:Nbr1 FW domain-containing protein n=1 Tax=Streptosporangium album TaxID=47479 RepID=A0A7W7W999_9ACTN|nr:NBR1-Ig-like domain-containing protein [Streptosporangium album]MBB4939177.1 hypothetical protein [Streptosporangium album]